MAEMISVSSSNINAIGYDPDSMKLTVEFKSGGTYEYAGVDPAMYTQFLQAESIGKFFHANIKGQFDHQKVG